MKIYEQIDILKSTYSSAVPLQMSSRLTEVADEKFKKPKIKASSNNLLGIASPVTQNPS